MMFTTGAARLAGVAGLVFGWAPEAFWRATPAELQAMADALRSEDADPPGNDEIARLKELFPDG